MLLLDLIIDSRLPNKVHEDFLFVGDVDTIGSNDSDEEGVESISKEVQNVGCYQHGRDESFVEGKTRLESEPG